MSDSNRASVFLPQYSYGIGGKSFWGRLYGSAKALAISQLAKQTKVPLLVVVQDSLAAGRLIQELNFYLPEYALDKLLFLPDWEILPYDSFSPYSEITSTRLATLARLPAFQQGILIVSVTTLMHRLIPQDFLVSNSFVLHTGQRLNTDSFKKQLSANGYIFVSQVTEHGEIAIRGSLIDFYPMGSEHPYRIDLLDDEIESIRTFDPETQRSLDQADEITILPAREIALVDQHIAHFRSNWRSRFVGNPQQCSIYRDVSQGLAPAGIEYYLPLFYDSLSTLFDYLRDDYIAILDEDVSKVAETFWQDIEVRYSNAKDNIERPVLPPSDIFLQPDDLLSNFNRYHQIYITKREQPEVPGTTNFDTKLPENLHIDARSESPLLLLNRFIDNFPGRILLAAESMGRREILLDMFQQHELKPVQLSHWSEFITGDMPLALVVAPVEHGVQLTDPMIALISEEQLFGAQVMQRRLRNRKYQDPEKIIRDLMELTSGAPVVHEDHGIGRYQGLVTLVTAGIPAEFICVHYAEEDKLYVPITALNLISRFTGTDQEHVPLHRLGSGHWEKAKRKASKQAHDVAVELLELHARRAACHGFAFTIDEHAYRSFAQAFPFEETPGQMAAIEAVISDMQHSEPMDRLICGDAGFGKTEVAMRASFIAIHNTRQVAILVPTTLLAQQHYQNFKDRFAEWPVSIELLSRFRTDKQQQATLHGIQAGTVDIVIGTHKLIQKKIKFSNLGLLIIDEEHRFGVRQKEKFKAMRSEIDVLTLTATPIPRTLNMALSSIREFSIITTPPSRRLAIKTFVCEWDTTLLKEAISREIKRGGQVYVLHNEIKTIEKIAQQMASLVAGTSVRYAHGQMPEKILEQVMLDFYHHRFNVLVCTTIIETGIDVPSANTIIINRADKFGLAQLYQLRGRVGRSYHRAYAYLIVPPRQQMTGDAIKRLEAIEALEELGVGLTLALHDLEIRGAGEILGEGQSGQIQTIGYGLYMELLNRAVTTLKSGKPSTDRGLENINIDLHIPALIPEDYLPDVHMRLTMYKRIASVESKDALRELRVEMIDRFGLLPEFATNLFQITELKLLVGPLGVSDINMDSRGGKIKFNEENHVDPARIMALIQQHPSTYQLQGQDGLRIIKELPQATDRFRILDYIMDHIIHAGKT